MENERNLIGQLKIKEKGKWILIHNIKIEQNRLQGMIAVEDLKGLSIDTIIQSPFTLMLYLPYSRDVGGQDGIIRKEMRGRITTLKNLNTHHVEIEIVLEDSSEIIAS